MSTLTRMRLRAAVFEELTGLEAPLRDYSSCPQPDDMEVRLKEWEKFRDTYGHVLGLMLDAFEQLIENR